MFSNLNNSSNNYSSSNEFNEPYNQNIQLMIKDGLKLENTNFKVRMTHI